MSYLEKYDKLNSFYLEMWGVLDQFFAENRRLEFAPVPHPELASSARRLTSIRERAALGQKLNEKTYGDITLRAQMKAQEQAGYLSILSSIEKEMWQRLDTIERAGVSPEDREASKADMLAVLSLLRDYGKIESDFAEWFERARQLKELIGDKALSYSKKIYSTEDEVWKDWAR